MLDYIVMQMRKTNREKAYCDWYWGTSCSWHSFYDTQIILCRFEFGVSLFQNTDNPIEMPGIGLFPFVENPCLRTKDLNLRLFAG